MLPASLPLTLRAPNPPALFVGREKEREQLRVAFARGPVTLVSGEHGVGKTATVLQVLRESFFEVPVVFASFGGLPDGVAPDRELVRIVAAAASVTQIAWASVLRVRESLPEVLLDMAERARLWLVLDGVTADPLLRDLMSVVSRYARVSRWIVTGEGFCESRFVPGQSLRLGPMPDDQLERLAHGSAARPLDLGRAVEASRGNPGALLRAVTSGAAPDASIVDPMLSAMRALADRNAATVLAWLDEHAEEALRDGYARNLYAVLSLRRHEPELGRWWMRCAAEVGDLAALPHGAAQHASLKDALVLLEAFFSGGDLDRSLRDAEALVARAEAEGAPRIAGEAKTIAVQCLVMKGELARALALVESIATEDDELACLRDGCASTVLASMHRSDEAHARLERVRAGAARLPFRAQNPILFRAADTLYQLGLLEEAHDVLSQLMSGDRARSLSFHHLGPILLLQLRIAIDRGALRDVAALEERLAPFAREGTLQHPFAGSSRVFARLWAGDFDGIGEEVSNSLQAAREGDLLEAQSAAAMAAIEVALARGTDLDVTLRDPLVLSLRNGAPANPLLEETLRRARLRLGEHVPSPPPAARSIEHEIVARLADAEAHVLRGAWHEATTASRAAVQHAARWGYASREAHARSTLTFLLLAQGRREEAAQQVGRLRESAERMGSARFIREAELLAYLSQPAASMLQLVAWTRDEAPAPIVARCARRLLGAPAGPDAVERTLFDALVGHLGRISHLAPGSLPSWGIADVDRSVVLDDGSRISFESKPLLWRLLEVLWDHGGEASKEELVREVWAQPDYHPLRDDNRLHVTIRKLRGLLMDGQPPARILTRDEGYALGGTPVRVR
ncbi:AAA family ATPase [Polyangium aurulentum]|uniref:AAA family ATPase n=1 Tax=Polyangium aurulentum TaxID=2567896 RepID=UPI0010AE4CD9|nr:AAA family ATPase [Polyangium aurulentum]UQA55609.1 hypothetical protein E8A73_030240 [Polyangium aurulentum]